MQQHASKRRLTRALFRCSLWLGAGVCASCASFGLPPTYVANPQTLFLSPVTIEQHSSGPQSYHAPTVHDASRAPQATQTVVGEACQSGFQLPWAYSAHALGVVSAGWGDGGYAEALTRAQAQAPARGLLYDVRADLRHTSVLSIWRQLCVVVTASVLPSPQASPPQSADALDKDDSSHGQARL